MRTWMRSDEVASRESVEALDARLCELEQVREREENPRPKAAPIAALLISAGLIVRLSRIPAPENATVPQYFTQLVGYGAVFVAAAGLAKALHMVRPKVRWDIAEEIFKAGGLFFLAIVALARAESIGF